MWRRKRQRLSCGEPGGECDFRAAREMVHHSLDGKVFRVRRLVCALCGKRVMAAEGGASFAPPAWQDDGAVEANF